MCVWEVGQGSVKTTEGILQVRLEIFVWETKQADSKNILLWI